MVDFTDSALADLDNILENTLDEFGTLQLERYTTRSRVRSESSKKQEAAHRSLKIGPILGRVSLLTLLRGKARPHLTCFTFGLRKSQ
jgi:hypothetical protein